MNFFVLGKLTQLHIDRFDVTQLLTLVANAVKMDHVLNYIVTTVITKPWGEKSAFLLYL